MANMSPPGPVLPGSTSASIAAAAIAASAAVPPLRGTCWPACAASGWLVATMPWRATTSERLCSGQFPARSPRSASTFSPGDVVSAVGSPNGVEDGPPWATANVEPRTSTSSAVPAATTRARLARTPLVSLHASRFTSHLPSREPLPCPALDPSAGAEAPGDDGRPPAGGPR